MQTASAPLVPDLGRLKAVSERVNIATSRLNAFLERYNGPVPSNTGDATKQPACYRDDIEDVFAQVERLETSVAALDSIG